MCRLANLNGIDGFGGLEVLIVCGDVMWQKAIPALSGIHTYNQSIGNHYLADSFGTRYMRRDIGIQRLIDCLDSIYTLGK